MKGAYWMAWRPKSASVKCNDSEPTSRSRRGMLSGKESRQRLRKAKRRIVPVILDHTTRCKRLCARD